MKQWYMVTAVGKDQPGIVAQVTRVLYQGGCNLGEASMTRLGDSFTMMVMAQAPVSATALQQLLQPVAENINVHIHVDTIDGVLHRPVVPNVGLSIFGADQAGLVAQITGTLAAIDFTIVNLESAVAGNEAQPIYVMNIEGYAVHGLESVEAAISCYKEKGLEIRITAIDPFLG